MILYPSVKTDGNESKVACNSLSPFHLVPIYYAPSCYLFVEILNGQIRRCCPSQTRLQALLYKGSRYAALNYCLVLFLQRGRPSGSDWPDGYV
ncbi:hypothetical protein MgSA37_02647 [Mucilaginibacter gotjawali]|uniref:Uncharacterized protein n=2 Tax=Mucilaginibacter gotjawali TaxID=1550579 RepID=A0A839SB59_9SPHI|nr:hypothetical protein [Mucilaginibacter gotjawali]BAU54471.1 hypothetical protein MgSA37_02647 [Mucilaginibacter gotjawali]